MHAASCLLLAVCCLLSAACCLLPTAFLLAVYQTHFPKALTPANSLVGNHTCQQAETATKSQKTCINNLNQEPYPPGAAAEMYASAFSHARMHNENAHPTAEEECKLIKRKGLMHIPRKHSGRQQHRFESIVIFVVSNKKSEN